MPRPPSKDIATGVAIPLGLHASTLTNFAGYVAWCLWLIAMAGSDPVGTANQ